MKLRIEIELGSAMMQTPKQVENALDIAAGFIGVRQNMNPDRVHGINDEKGQPVGKWEVVEPDEVYAELVNALAIALPFVEDCEDSDVYKPGAVKKQLKAIRTALEHAGAYQVIEPHSTAAPLIVFDDRELATVLHGLRIIQESAKGPAELCDHFEEAEALTDAEIDALCDRLNLQPIHQNEAEAD